MLNKVEKKMKVKHIDSVVTPGKITAYQDGVCTIVGLSDCKIGSRINILTQGFKTATALVLNIKQHYINAIMLGDEQYVAVGDIAILKENLLSLGVNFNLYGKIINALGKIQYGEKLKRNDETKNKGKLEGSFVIEQKATGIIDRVPIRRPLMTGVKAVDNLIPIGKGQRELIIGDKQTGKTSIALDTILNYKETNNNIKKAGKGNLTLEELRRINWFVYCGIGQKQSTVLNIYKVLKTSNTEWYTSIVNASAADSAALQFLCPYTGTTLAEYVRDVIGGDSIVIFDDLSKHAVAYRQMSLLLRRPPGREAYPGDVFYLHSRLLERAGALTNVYSYNGLLQDIIKRGSITALPIIETQAGDVSAYIPTNVISITDGQIFLESELFYRGIHPAINVGLSVSRIGSNAQYPILKTSGASLKVELAQYREVENFATFGAELDDFMVKLLFRGENIIEILKQDVNKPESLIQQVTQLFLSIGLNKKFENNFRENIKSGSRIFSNSLPLNHNESWLEILRLNCNSFSVEDVKPFIKAIFTFAFNSKFDIMSKTKSAGETLLEMLSKSPSFFFNDMVNCYLINNMKNDDISITYNLYDYGANNLHRKQLGPRAKTLFKNQLCGFDLFLHNLTLCNDQKKKKHLYKVFSYTEEEKSRTMLKIMRGDYEDFTNEIYQGYKIVEGHIKYGGNSHRSSPKAHPFDPNPCPYTWLRSRAYDEPDFSREYMRFKYVFRKKNFETFGWSNFIENRIFSIIFSSFFLFAYTDLEWLIWRRYGGKNLLKLINLQIDELFGFIKYFVTEFTYNILRSEEMIQKCKLFENFYSASLLADITHEKKRDVKKDKYENFVRGSVEKLFNAVIRHDRLEYRIARFWSEPKLNKQKCRGLVREAYYRRLYPDKPYTADKF